MAKHFLRGESVPVILPENLINAAALLSQLDRKQVGAAIEVLMLLLDLSEDDPDQEDDDPSGQYDEDDWTTPLPASAMSDDGPGCPIADPGEYNGDQESGESIGHSS